MVPPVNTGGTNTTVPPVNTGIGGEPYVPYEVTDMWVTIGTAIIISLVCIIIIAWLWKRGVKRQDVDPTLSDLSIDPYDPNKAAMVMLALMVPAMFGIIFGIDWLFVDVGIGASLIVGSVSFTAIPYFMARDRAREGTRNKLNMAGDLYTKGKKKGRYLFSNVDFEVDVQMDAEDKAAIIASGTVFKDEEVITEKILDTFHIKPAVINGFNVFFLFEEAFANAIDWTECTEYDYYGSYLTKSAGPVLKEVTKIQRVNVIETDDGNEYINEYTFVFWVMWDDSHAAKKQAGVELVTVSTNEVLSSISKIVHTDRKVIGSVVADMNDELLAYQEHGVDNKDIVASMSRMKAMELREAEDSLKRVDISLLRGSVTVFTALVFAFATLVLGILIGSG